MDFRTFAKSSGPPPNLPIPPGVITNSVSQQLNNLRMTESSMSSMLRTQQEHARSLERMATMQRHIIEMQQIQTQQLHSMQQMMLPLAFQCNAFMSSMSSLVPGVGNLFTQPLTFVQSALGSSGTLCDPSHGLPGSSPGPLVQSAVLPAGPGPSVLTPSGPEPKRRRLDLQPDPLHELQSATSSVQVPHYGLYHHVKQSGTSNTPERIWSSVSERVVPPVRNETVCFTIRRTQTDDPFQTSHEVKEMVHPQLKTQGFQFWVALPVATFSSELLVGANDLFKTIDILFLYQQMLRIHKSIADNPFAWRMPLKMECWSKIRDVNNGYLMLTILTPPVVTLLMKMQWITLNFGMITFRLTWSIDCLHNYVTLFCVILFWHLSAFWLLLWDVTATMFHWLRNLRSFSTPSNSLLRSMRTWHSRSGVRTILIFFSTSDLAIIHQYWEWPQLCEKGSFDHHHAMYGAQTGWLPIPSTLGEYCSMMILPFLGNMCWKTKKFGGLNTARPICIVGRAFARQAHIRTSQGGVYADQLLGYFFDVVHGSDSRWAVRSHLSTIHGVATFIS